MPAKPPTATSKPSPHSLWPALLRLPPPRQLPLLQGSAIDAPALSSRLPLLPVSRYEMYLELSLLYSWLII